MKLAVRVAKTRADLLGGLLDWRVWVMLAWQDIKLRYRRSKLGPFWITVTMAVMIYSMGFLYGHLFHMNLQEYFPYIAGGLITWNMIATMINETTNAFIEAGGYIKQIKLPYTTYMMRVVLRNWIVFFHNLLAVIPIMLYFHRALSVHCLFVFLGLLILGITGFSYGMLFAMLGSRFRDIQQMINSFVQILFLITPIMWMPSLLPQKMMFVVDLNPIQQLINLVRAPLMGALPSMYSVIYASLFALLGFFAMVLLMLRARHRIVYWV